MSKKDEVLALVDAGVPYASIAERLRIPYGTVAGIAWRAGKCKPQKPDPTFDARMDETHRRLSSEACQYPGDGSEINFSCNRPCAVRRMRNGMGVIKLYCDHHMAVLTVMPASRL